MGRLPGGVNRREGFDTEEPESACGPSSPARVKEATIGSVALTPVSSHFPSPPVGEGARRADEGAVAACPSTVSAPEGADPPSPAGGEGKWREGEGGAGPAS